MTGCSMENFSAVSLVALLSLLSGSGARYTKKAVLATLLLGVYRTATIIGIIPLEVTTNTGDKYGAL